MDAAVIRQVWQRAHRCCEYCRMPQDYDEATFEIDHIIASKHGGPTVGRVTIVVLQINDPFRVELRAGLIEEDLFPPAL
jgi:hypothetical protein